MKAIWETFKIVGSVMRDYFIGLVLTPFILCVTLIGWMGWIAKRIMLLLYYLAVYFTAFIIYPHTVGVSVRERHAQHMKAVREGKGRECRCGHDSNFHSMLADDMHMCRVSGCGCSRYCP